MKSSFKSIIISGKLLISLVGITSTDVFAQPVATLKDMVEKTITSNPEVQAKYHKFLEAGYEQDVARGNFLPDANIVSTYRKQEQMVNMTGNTTTPRMNNELVLRQMIFDGFATSNDVKRLGHASRARFYELQSTMQNIALEFVRAYFDSLRFRELSQFAKDNYVIHKQLHDRIQERVTAGVARKVDLEQAAGRLALAEANLLTEMTNLHDVTARMVRLYGELPPDSLEVPQFTVAGVETNPAEALKLAYFQNPDLLATIEDIQAKEKEIKFNEARYLPRLDLQARKNLGTSSDGRNSVAAADVLELTMNFNLFNGFSDSNLIKQSAEKLNNSRDLRDKACVDVRQQVSIAYNDIRQLSEQQGYRERHVVSIENAREAYRKQFDIGQRTLLDLLDTENEYFQSRRSLANTIYDKQIAYARVYAGQGELLRKIGAARGNLPDYAREAYADEENVCQVIAPEQLEVDKAQLLANAKPLSATFNSAVQPLNQNKPLPVAPVPAPVNTPPQTACTTEDVTAFIDDWANAWRKKDTEKFLTFYSDKFEPDPPLSREEWKKEKVKNLSTKSKITFNLKDVQVKCEGDKAIVNFNQDYELTSFSIKKEGNNAGCEVCNMKRIPVTNFASNYDKELTLERQGKDWKILKELVKK